MTTRRVFLGAAAALAGLSATNSAGADAPEPEITVDEETGSGRANVPRKSEVWSALEIFEDVDEDTHLGVSGFWMDDEPPSVEFRVDTQLAGLTVNLSLEEARELAADLQLAATHAEQGAAEMGYYDD